MPFVPASFEPPRALDRPRFRLRPLGPEHAESDYAAWTSSIDHIRRTPGFVGRSWPREMTLEENRADCEMHAEHFRAREGFTYTVLEPDADVVIGCVYVYPGADGSAEVRSWVTGARTDLDDELHRTVRTWLEANWPFALVSAPGRHQP